jgi:hypothetical protein
MLSIALSLFVLGMSRPILGYSEMSGSCNGLFGIHLPSSVSGDGGYKIGIQDSHIGSDGYRKATIAIEHVRFMNGVSETVLNSTVGTGGFRGFLLKAYDPYTGNPLGSFLKPLPAHTMFYNGCPSPQSSISHHFTPEEVEAQENFFVLQTGFVILFTWPATQTVAFQLFVVEGLTTWFEVLVADHTDMIPPPPPLSCLPEVSTAFVLVGFLPLAVLTIAGLLLGLESTSALLSRLNHVFVLGPKYSGWTDAGAGRSLSYWADVLTFGAWETVAGATVVEAVAHTLFWSTQAAALICAIEWVCSRPRPRARGASDRRELGLC